MRNQDLPKEVRITTIVSPQTHKQIREKAKELQVDIITITEWLIEKGLKNTEIDEIEPQPLPRKSDHLQNTLDNIDARLSWLEGQIADAHICIIKTEIKEKPKNKSGY